MILEKDEKLEDLQCDGLQLIQSENESRFTTDAVLLANFVGELKGKTMVEFCAGSGVISILVAHKKHAKKIYAVELQPQLASLAGRNVQLNGLSDTIEVLNADLADMPKTLGGVADAVVCNPPYRKVGSGERQEQLNFAICRHEIATNMQQICYSASKVLNNKGSFYVVYQSARIAELIAELSAVGIATKEILPVCPRPDAEPVLVLVRGVKGGKSDCVLHKPMCILDENGRYSPEAKAYYGLND